MTPPEIPPDMAAPEFDEDDQPYWKILVLYAAGILGGGALVTLTLLAWRGLQCGVL